MFTTTNDLTLETLCKKRNELDKEINKFREKVLTPTKVEHALFIKMKDERKKLQHIIKSIKKKERNKKEKALYEMLKVLSKDELKRWRVISHKSENIKANLIQIQSSITELSNNTKYQSLVDTLRDSTNVFYDQFSNYHKIVYDVENVITKQFYRDKKVVEIYKNDQM
jgi:sucrose-6-phosphate hydrolase SacC (GH32 family)